MMASFYCKCGDRLNNVQAPNDTEWIVYSDREWDRILEVDTINTWEIPSPNVEVWRCPKCERVYVFKDNRLIKYYVLHSIDEFTAD
jgi:hypothetical protein